MTQERFMFFGGLSTRLIFDSLALGVFVYFFDSEAVILGYIFSAAAFYCTSKKVDDSFKTGAILGTLIASGAYLSLCDIERMAIDLNPLHLMAGLLASSVAIMVYLRFAK
jgi:hypothetical protein